MSEIQFFNEITELSSGDLLPVYSSANGARRKASINTLKSYMQSNLTLSDSIPQYVTQYSAPSATGFNVAVNSNSNNTHLILTPVAGYATGTITLPLNTVCIDKQLFMVNCTQAVTTLTVSGNGATVVGQPTAFSANGFFTLKYDLTLNRWYRVG